MKTAGATGVLALQEHGLKEVPEGLFLLVKLRVSDEQEKAKTRAPTKRQPVDPWRLPPYLHVLLLVKLVQIHRNARSRFRETPSRVDHDLPSLSEQAVGKRCRTCSARVLFFVCGYDAQ